MTWTLLAITEPAARTLDAWSVYEVPFDGIQSPWTRHFVGFRLEGCVGQVSSPVEQLDPGRRRGRTRSGRVYELTGWPGLNSDALATWGRWKTSRGIEEERDVTQAVTGLLQPPDAHVHADTMSKDGLASVVQQALHDVRYWDAFSDLPMQGHRQHDLRSLALHEAAVRKLVKRPELARRALDVLARWEAQCEAHSLPLLKEWRRIIEVQDWRLAVERSDRGQQLRQASPLAFVLEEAEREAIRTLFRRSGGGK